MAYEKGGWYILPHGFCDERLSVGDQKEFRGAVDLNDGFSSPSQDLLLEVTEVREEDYIFRIVEVL